MNSPLTRAYSAFWPLQLFFLAVIIWISFQIVQLRGQQVAAEEVLGRLAPQVEVANGAKQKLIALAQDLKKTGNAAAERILKETQIQVEEPRPANGLAGKS